MKQQTSAVGLLPYEIAALVDHQLATPYYTNACSPRFIDEVREFLEESVIQPAAKFRAAYGMPAALTPIEPDEHKDGNATKEQRAVVDNKTKVSDAQIRTFLQLCWIKFVKAKVEPGAVSRCFFSCI